MIGDFSKMPEQGTLKFCPFRKTMKKWQNFQNQHFQNSGTKIKVCSNPEGTYF